MNLTKSSLRNALRPIKNFITVIRYQSPLTDEEFDKLVKEPLIKR
jgi:hypothetical protein